jgi:signal transduction histidine kinase
VLDDLGLEVALQELVNDCRARFPGVEYRLTAAGELETLGEQINITIYRIVQECLTNIAKHAAATRVTISLTTEAGRHGKAHASDTTGLVGLVVSDNGRGMNGISNGRGLGIAGMRERVEALHGQFTIETPPAGGVTVSIAIPTDATMDEQA